MEFGYIVLVAELREEFDRVGKRGTPEHRNPGAFGATERGRFRVEIVSLKLAECVRKAVPPEDIEVILYSERIIRYWALGYEFV